MSPGWELNDACLAFLSEPIAVAFDLNDVRVVRDAVEHRGGQGAGTGEGLVLLAKGQIRGQNERAFFISVGNDLKEQVCLIFAHRQISDLVNDEQTRPPDTALHDLLRRPWRLGGLKEQHEISGGYEACLQPRLGGKITKRYGYLSFSHPTGAEQHEVSLRSIKASEVRA